MKKVRKVYSKLISYLLILLGFGYCLSLKSCGCEYGAPVEYGGPPIEFKDLISNTKWFGEFVIDGLKSYFNLRIYESYATLKISLPAENGKTTDHIYNFILTIQDDSTIILTPTDSELMLKGIVVNSKITLYNAKTGEKMGILYKD